MIWLLLLPPPTAKAELDAEQRVDDEIARLTALSNDDSLSAKAKASQELAQIHREPLPLNRARINQDVAV